MIKRLILLLLCFYVLLMASCKQSPNDNDQSDGVRTEKFPGTDVVKKSMEYKNGKKHGRYQEFYPSGKLKLQGVWIYGLRQGVFKKYYETGQIKIEEHFVNGKLEGWTKVYDKKGNIQSEVMYSKDERNGPFNTYYEDGKPNKLFNFKNGRKDGEIKEYYKNGQLRSVAYYQKGCPGIGLKEYRMDGQEINNDFKITYTEKNTLLIDNKYSYIFKMSSPQASDELWEIELKDGKYLVMEGDYNSLPKSDQNTFKKVFLPRSGDIIPKQLNLVAVRKTAQDNYYIKKYSVNVSIGTNF